MRPFRAHVLEALDLIEPLPLRMIAPAHGPILRDAPERYVARYRELSAPGCKNEAADEKTLLVFYLSAYGSTRAHGRGGGRRRRSRRAACASRSTTSKAAR